MLTIAIQDKSPRASVAEGRRRSFSLPFSPLALIDGLSRKSFSYAKLPVEPLKLSVLKLDGSSFDIEVMRTSTIGELMLAVEAVFFHVQKISWSHVWGHFCLCYDGQKLVKESDYINNYGIKDGDQLHFIRHISSNCILTKRSSKKKTVPSHQKRWSMLDSRKTEENEKKVEENGDCDDIENGRFQHYNSKEGEIVVYQHCNDQDGEMIAPLHIDNRNEKVGGNRECSLSDIFRGWFSYSRLPTSERKKLKGWDDDSSRIGCGLFSSFREVVGMYGNKSYSRKFTY